MTQQTNQLPDDGGERYQCIEPTCQNMIYFGSKDFEYYIARGWVDQNGEPMKPKRCRTCRAKKKAEREAHTKQS